MQRRLGVIIILFGFAAQFTLPPVEVGAYDTVDDSLSAAMNQLPLPLAYFSIRIQYSGAPGSMIAQVSSVDERQDLVVDARAMNEGDGWAGSGANPWHLDANTQSVLFLTDESDQPARIGFSITVGAVHYYLTSLKLAPHETRAIDLRQLRDAQVADFKKNKIPTGASDGSVNWNRLDNVAVSGRVVVISRSGAIASSYDCCTCPCPEDFNSCTIDVGTVGNGAASLYCYADYVDCNNNYDAYDVTADVAWSSSNTSVATVNSGDVTGVSAGTATITGGPRSDYQYAYEFGSCYGTLTSASAGVSITIGEAVTNYIFTDMEGTDCAYYLYCPNGNTGASCPTPNPVLVDSTHNTCLNYVYDTRLKAVINGKNYCFPIGIAHLSNTAVSCN